MKKRLTVLFLFIVLSSGSLFSQQGWFWLNMTPYSSGYCSSFFLDNNIGYISNAEGILFKTYNGGASMIPMNTNTGTQINDINFQNQLIGYVSCMSNDLNHFGYILKTTTGGLTWETIMSINNPFFSLYFVNSQTGFAGGNYVFYKTTNGGNNWINCTIGANLVYESMDFINDSIGFVAASGNNITNIFKTTNQGMTWVSKYTGSVLNDIRKIRFLNSTTGIAIALQGNILRSTDSGESWYFVLNDEVNQYLSLSVSNGNIATVSGRNGKLLLSTNSGLNWSSINTGTTTYISTSKFFNSNTGFIAGSEGYFSRTTNGGTNWFTNSTLINTKIYSSSHIGNDVLYAVSDSGKVLKTLNGGRNWTISNTGTSNSLTTASIVSRDFGVVAGIGGYIYKTNNGGTNWNRLITGPITDVCFVNFFDSLKGTVIDIAGDVYKTYDSGLNWMHYNFYSIPIINTAFAVDTSYYYAAGVWGYVAKSTNGGSNWVSFHAGSSSEDFNSIYFIDRNTGYCGGTAGCLYKTTNGGLNWSKLSINSTTEIKSIYFINKDTGLVCGKTGMIKKTIDGGLSWYSQISTSYSNLNNIVLTSNDTSYAFGDNGTILKTLTCGDVIGIRTISSSIPSKYTLSQNYPNPFNSTSKLKFEIVKFSNVKIVVYDISGREVQTLINEWMQPGTYETTFDGSMLNSGVYFYKLITDGFSETKKMVLIK
jgi:photosystem II stability/assembly factor-like uncharacterized protein